MLFPTVTFAIFFMIVLPVSWLTMPHPGRWRAVIVLASYVFYAFGGWRYIFLLGGSTLFNHFVALAIHRQRDKPRLGRWLLIGGIAGNLAALGYFKYYDFFVSSTQNFLRGIGLGVGTSLTQVALPIGISFYTFMAISYVVDVHQGKLRPTTLPKFAAFLSFFPHLVSGPIVRASELVPQFATPRDPRRVDTSRAFMLIVGGLFKKVVIATVCAKLVDQVYGAPDQASGLETLVAIYAYAVQIYADFSGYTDIAIGLALLLGFKFPQNFNAPYSAVSVQDFWRRWHMTLSRWFRDYVYIPLGGNRKGSRRTYVNLVATMLLAGLWHGAAFTFVAWGALHGLGQAVGRLRASRRTGAALDSRRRRVLARLATFHFVCLAWVFFRADSFANAAAVIGRLFGGWGLASPGVTAAVLAAIAVGLGSQFLPEDWTEVVMARFSRFSVAAQGVGLGACLMVINAIGPSGIAPFIYFRF